jgi:hypothetical protein
MSRWTDEKIRVMEEDPDYWDLGSGELYEPVPPERRGSVAAVKFSSEDFRRVGHAAEQAGQNVIEFIRQAALERAAQFPAPPARAPRRA